jgi:hypothetical protein
VIQCRYRLLKWADSEESARELYELLKEPGRVQIPTSQRARFLSAYGIVLSKLGKFDQAIPPLTCAHEF